MNFLEIKNISDRFMDLINPISPEKIIQVGQAMGLQEGDQVLDMGSGFGELLVLWAEHFGIQGVGVEVRAPACKRAQAKINQRGLSDRLRIVCQNAAEYPIQANRYDAVTCLGATFIWDGFRGAIQNLKPVLRTGGHLVMGEPYWRRSQVPPEIAEQHQIHQEIALLEIIREESMTLKYLVRASESDWDRYESEDWLGLVDWLGNHPDHPDREVIQSHFLKEQEEYLRYGREYIGWAIYVLTSAI